MVNLAFKSVLHGWRQYLPVVIAVGVSGLMMVAQVALAMGAFSLSAAPVRQSMADLWVGPADARALDESRELSQLAAGRLWLDPDIARIEPYVSPGYAMIGEDEATGKSAVLAGLDVHKDAMLLARAVPPALRARLAEPGTAILDRSDARKLSVGIGGNLKVNRQTLRVVGLLDGVRAPFGVRLIVSEATQRDLSQGAGAGVAFYLVRLRPGADAGAVMTRLAAGIPTPEYRVWRPGELAAATVRFWALDSGAGTLLLASGAIALAITLMVVAQTLGAAVAGAMREYAALRAYGIGFRAVQCLVMKQGLYVCLAALVVTAATSVLVLGFLRQRGVASELPLPMAAGVALALAATVIVSNLFALHRLRRADPASLLR